MAGTGDAAATQETKMKMTRWPSQWRPVRCFAGASAQVSGDTVKIGFITDMSGLYADIDGGRPGSHQMAIDDFGGKVLGKPIELVSADHQNKADIAASKAREWMDQQGWTCCSAAPTPAPAWP
jgi:ABC-type branched-subunit amino acid transport system substrate-binding protein